MRNKQNRKFLINAGIIAALTLLVAIRMPTWGVPQIFVIIILVAITAFQLLLYFKLK